MTAALVVAATSPLAPALLAVLVRLGLALPAPRPGVLAAHIIADQLDDYTWRAGQLAQIRDHYDLVRAVAGAAEEWALARVYSHHADPAVLEPRPARGIDVISRWWTPAPVIGRPPLTTRRIPGAALTGASA